MPADPSAGSRQPSEIATTRGQFLIDGRPFFVRGIHYGPWRPGTGPNKRYPYPDLKGIADDFAIIRQTHANTVLVYDAPPGVLDLADTYGLKVVYCFALDWYALGGETQPAIRARVVERITELRSKPALLAWLLGNEIGDDALKQRGEGRIITGLHDLYSAAKTADPRHPISHANWPPARHLDLRFLDFVSFNVYPLWPPEVVAMGFGPFIRDVLRPIAGNKPLLITEFGANTIEAGEQGQQRLLRDSWHGLVEAGAAGGIVFEFADEWWKNYDNPVRSGDWWDRVPAADDEARQDDDPEENYGLVRADRTAKPALQVVSALFAEETERSAAREIDVTVLATLLLAAGGSWLWAHRRVALRTEALTTEQVITRE